MQNLSKLYIFLNTFYTDKKTRDAISAKVRRNNAVAVWCYAPGFITDNGFDVTTMKELTGIELAEENEQKTLTLEIVDKDSPITKYAQKFSPFTFGPVFNVTDKEIKVLGTAAGKPALVVKDCGNWRSVYSLLPLNKELLKGLCDYAGAHLYSKDDDVFMANKSFLMIHTSTEGDKTINLPEKCDVTEILTNQEIGKGLTSFSEKLPAQATRIYQITKDKSFFERLFE